jgi:hypothetical protein
VYAIALDGRTEDSVLTEASEDRLVALVTAASSPFHFYFGSYQLSDEARCLQNNRG